MKKNTRPRTGIQPEQVEFAKYYSGGPVPQHKKWISIEIQTQAINIIKRFLKRYIILKKNRERVEKLNFTVRNEKERKIKQSMEYYKLVHNQEPNKTKNVFDEIFQ